MGVTPASQWDTVRDSQSRICSKACVLITDGHSNESLSPWILWDCLLQTPHSPFISYVLLSGQHFVDKLYMTIIGPDHRHKGEMWTSFFVLLKSGSVLHRSLLWLWEAWWKMFPHRQRAPPNPWAISMPGPIHLLSYHKNKLLRHRPWSLPALSQLSHLPRLLCLLEPHFLHLKNGDNNTYL